MTTPTHIKIGNISLPVAVELAKSKHMPKYHPVLWTKETAQAVLDACNSKNRDLKPAAVAKIVQDMKSGNFALTNQTIGFDCSGELVDGQTRLSAIVEYGKPFTLMTVSGLPVDAQ